MLFIPLCLRLCMCVCMCVCKSCQWVEFFFVFMAFVPFIVVWIFLISKKGTPATWNCMKKNRSAAIRIFHFSHAQNRRFCVSKLLLAVVVMSMFSSLLDPLFHCTIEFRIKRVVRGIRIEEKGSEQHKGEDEDAISHDWMSTVFHNSQSTDEKKSHCTK